MMVLCYICLLCLFLFLFYTGVGWLLCGTDYGLALLGNIRVAKKEKNDWGELATGYPQNSVVVFGLLFEHPLRLFVVYL